MNFYISNCVCFVQTCRVVSNWYICLGISCTSLENTCYKNLTRAMIFGSTFTHWSGRTFPLMWNWFEWKLSHVSHFKLSLGITGMELDWVLLNEKISGPPFLQWTILHAFIMVLKNVTRWEPFLPRMYTHQGFQKHNDDLYIIGAVCMSVTFLLISFSPFSRHFWV